MSKSLSIFKNTFARNGSKCNVRNDYRTKESDTTTLSDFVSDVKDKLFPPRYIAYAPMNPVPIQAVPPGSTTSPLAAAEVASLVASSSHTKGTSGDNRSSLISGR